MPLFDYLGGNFETPSFTDLFPSIEDFQKWYVSDENDPFVYDNKVYLCPIQFVQSADHSTYLTTDSLVVVYYQLYAKYGNSHIAYRDVMQFLVNLSSILLNYGPTWQKKVEIQETLRELTDDDIRLGTKAIYNHAFNPATDITDTAQLDELTAINEQNTTNFKQSPTDAYVKLYSILTDSVTDIFINRFRRLFVTIVEPNVANWYVEEN